MVQKSTFEAEIKSYKHRQNAAVKLIKIVSDLWFNHTIELIFFRNQLVDRRVSKILNLHEESKALSETPISIFATLQVAEKIQNLKLAPSRIDIGKLALKIREQDIDDDQLLYFIKKELISAKEHKSFEPRDVVLYGFGRIGRLLARELITKAGAGHQLRLRAIVTRDQIDPKTLKKRAMLLQNDSIHGEFEGTVDIDAQKGALIINGATVYIISAKEPEAID